MKPLVGIVMRPNINPSNQYLFVGYKDVIDAVIKSGGIPVGIFPTTIDDYYDNDHLSTKKTNEKEFAEMKRIIDLCDGIICQGGRDFYDYDLKIIEYAYKRDIPLFGICLGMQAMSYLFNGEMKRIIGENHQSKDNYVHYVKIDPQSKFFQIINKDNLLVNSRHSWHVLNSTLDIVGISDDNIIEIVEDKDKKFFIGVQWHPESMLEYDITMKELFESFIDACKVGD